MSDKTKSVPTGERQDDASRRNSGDADQAGGPGYGEAPEPGSNDPRDAAQNAPEADSQADPETGGAGRDDDDSDEQSLTARLEAAQATIAEQKDRYMRAAAEAENIRRRAENDVASARKFAVEGFAAEILAVRDSLEIANSLEIKEDDAGAVTKMKEGLELTLKQLDNALSKFAIEAVEPQKGDKLDPERHQAMSTQESENVQPNHILSVIQRGYTIHGRLLRPAMVVVAKKPADEAGSDSDTA